MSSIQAMKATKKKVNPSTLSSTVKAHEDLYYICLNFKEMLSPMINESRSGTDLGSQVVLPGIRSCLYSEHGTGSCGVTVVPGGNEAQLRLCTAQGAPPPTGIPEKQR